MSILERVGLGPKPNRRPRRAGLKLEGRAGGREPRMPRRMVWERFGLLSLLVVLTLLAFPRVRFYENTAEIGDVWLDEDLIAPFNFPIRLTAAELEAKRDSIRATEPPVFALQADATAQSQARLDTLNLHLDEVFGAYRDWQLAQTRGQAAEDTRADSSRYAGFRARFPVTLTEVHWAALLGSYAARSGELPTDTRTGATGPPLDDRLLRSLSRLIASEFGDRVLSVSRDSIQAETIFVRNEDPRVRDERARPLGEVLGIDEAYAMAQQALVREYGGNRETVRLGLAFFRFALQPSLVYQREASEQRMQERMAEIRPTRGLVRQNMTIVRRGDEVTPAVYEQLASLEYAQRDRSGEISTVRTWLGETLLVLAAFSIFFLYLYLLRRQVYTDLRLMVLITLLMGGSVLGFWVVGQIDLLSDLAVPVGLASIMITIIFDSRVGMFATVTLAALGGLVFGFDFEFTFATIFAGFVAVFSVRDVKNRSHLVLSAALVLGAYLIIGLGYALLRADPFESRLMLDLRSILVNGTLLLLASPLLWAAERTFKVTTDLTLLELSDTNRDLLKNLSLRAPGTFNHALQVANLAEAAADAVGANALRARVGALYHDIGKMLKPEYYIENQQPGENPHDRITPYMSALIIASHVKDGLELGREHGLPQVVLDFIPTHHGTTMMEYFYRRAKEQQGEDDPPVNEAEFRYPGPRPATSEQAIVMLADSVEAASRSLEKPTPRRLEALIDAIFKARTEDGQLGASPLTFSDLSQIKETFLSILCGIYHFRVKYPGQPDATAPEEAVRGDGATEHLHLKKAAGLDVQVPQDAPEGAVVPDAASRSPEERSSMG